VLGGTEVPDAGVKASCTQLTRTSGKECAFYWSFCETFVL